MGLILKDPATFLPGPDDGPGAITSTMPLGGSPDDDRAFLNWIDRYAASANCRALDTLQRRGVSPRADVCRPWQIMNHLYRVFAGLHFPNSNGPTYSHKVRYLAIQFRLRPNAMIAETAEYVARLIEEVPTS